MQAKQYVKEIQARIHDQDQGQTEYLQAVDEFLPTVKAFLAQQPQLIEKKYTGCFN